MGVGVGVGIGVCVFTFREAVVVLPAASSRFAETKRSVSQSVCRMFWLLVGMVEGEMKS